MTGNLNTNGQLTVSGATSLKNNLTVDGNTTLSGATTVSGALSVSGNTNITGSLTVSGNTVLATGTNSHAYLGQIADQNKLVTIKELNTYQEGLHPKPASFLMLSYDIGSSFQNSVVSTENRSFTVNGVETNYVVNTYNLDLSGKDDGEHNQGLKIDGITISPSHVGTILLINQPSTNRNENGLYKILSVDVTNAKLNIVRINEADGRPGNDLSVGDYTLVSNGYIHQGGWVCSQTPPIPGTDSVNDIIVFTQFSGASELEVSSSDNSITINTIYDGSTKKYNLSAAVESIDILLDGDISGNKSLPTIFKMIDNNFKVLFQAISVGSYNYQNFYSAPAVTNNNPSSTDYSA